VALNVTVNVAALPAGTTAARGSTASQTGPGRYENASMFWSTSPADWLFTYPNSSVWPAATTRPRPIG
jgi:hypothetical protein